MMLDQQFEAFGLLRPLPAVCMTPLEMLLEHDDHGELKG